MEKSALTIQESQELTRLEGVILSGLETFVQVGQALLEIRERKLYRAAAKTWEIYLRERWDISKAHGNRLIRASGLNKILDNLAPTGAISNERQARRLLSMEAHEPDNGQSQEDVYRQILARIKRDEADNKAYGKTEDHPGKDWREVAEAKLRGAIKAWAGRSPKIERKLSDAWALALGEREAPAAAA